MIINYTKIKCALSIFLITAVLFTISCSKKSGDPNPDTGTKTPVDNTPTINALSLYMGVDNTEIVIYGTNFSTTLTDDKVYFNGKAATVTAATPTQLTVTVPQDAGTGSVTVSVKGGTTISGPIFSYVSVISIDVNSGPSGTVVKITGSGFSTTLTDNKVSFNGKPAVVTAATPTQLTVIVPVDGGPAPIKVSVGTVTIFGPVFNYVATGPLTINSIDVPSGIAGSSVNITGTGFSNTPTDNKIFFNGKAATVTLATPNHLIVTVPQEAGCGKITATVYGQTITGPNFNYYLSSTVTTLAGGYPGGFADGNGSNALFSSQIRALTTDNAGNIYATDYGNYSVRKITPSGTVTTLVGTGTLSTNVPGDIGYIAKDNLGNIYYSVSTTGNIYKIVPGGNVSVFFSAGYVTGLASDNNNNIYFSNFTTGLIERITSTGVQVIAGNGQGSIKDGTGINATFYAPGNIAVAASGNIYLSDLNGIRKINTSGEVSTFSTVIASSIAFDNNENLYVTNPNDGNVIKFIDHTTGAVSIVAGKIGIRYEYLDGDGLTATFSYAVALTFDAAGNIYVGDGYKIRKITLK